MEKPRFFAKVITTGRAVVNIPVVVHVVWNSDIENISDEQIESQIEVLNQDFNAENVEIADVPVFFESLIGDIDFHFCLASQDPDGNPTNGITRTQTTNAQGIGGTTNLHYSSLGGHDAWDTDKYLNIWVAKFSGGLGGVASFPGEGPADEQGVEINYKQFGTMGTATQPPYHLGRTCTHEVGHYFNLEHVWGPNLNSCCGEDDGVEDTPDSCEDYLHECPDGNTFSCTQPDMWMNFMNYTDDACMAMFSKGQKQRMYQALENFRPGLLNASGCMSVPVFEAIEKNELVVFENPTNDLLRFEIKSSSTEPWQISLVNAIGQPIFNEKKMGNTIHGIKCGDLPSGIYLLVASQKNTRLVKRVVIF